MLSYHGLAHLRPFFRPKVFLLLKTPPSPIRSRVSKLPLRRSPGAEFPMAAQVHGCFRRAPRASPPHECHSCWALQVRGCAGPAEPERRSLRQKPSPLSRHAADDVCLRFRYARRTMTHNLSLQVRPCRQLRSGEWGNDGQAIVRYENPLQSGKAMLPLCLSSGCSGPADAHWCWDHRLAFVDPNTTKGPEANLLLDITSDRGDADVVLFRFMTCQECTTGSFDSYSQNLHLPGRTREENTATDETVR